MLNPNLVIENNVDLCFNLKLVVYAETAFIRLLHINFLYCRGITIVGRTSTKQNKNIYQLSREELGLSREKASELLVTVPQERIEKIESEKSLPHPDEVMIMADGYKAPSLCNYYCANQCPIGQKYVPELKIKDLSQIVLEMLASLNSMNRKQERLIEITADGKIDRDEIDDFIRIQEELDRISMTADTLRLWSEQMLADGVIDSQEYEHRKKNIRK